MATRDKTKTVTMSRQKLNALYISVAVLVTILLLGIMTFVYTELSQSNESTAGSSSEVIATASDSHILGDPIVFSSGMTGEAYAGRPTIAMYLDFTCPGCMHLEHELNGELIDAAQAGDLNLLMIPVVTAGGDFNTAATSVLIAVADSDYALVEQTFSALTETGYLLVSGEKPQPKNADEAMILARDVVKKTGVAEDIVNAATFEDGESYLTESTNAWVSFATRSEFEPTTPQFIAMSQSEEPRLLEPNETSSKAFIASLLAQAN